MSTRSAIGIKNSDGFITGVYCHYDGYLDHNGRILKEHYDNKNKVEELLSYGDMSSLRENINPNDNEEHNFEHKQRDVCVFYHRDRGESWEDTAPCGFDNEKDFTDYYSDSDYYYLFNNGWEYKTYKNNDWKVL